MPTEPGDLFRIAGTLFCVVIILAVILVVRAWLFRVDGPFGREARYKRHRQRELREQARAREQADVRRVALNADDDTLRELWGDSGGGGR